MWTARTPLTLLWIHVPTVTCTHTHTYVQHTNRMMSKWLELLLSWRTSIQSPNPVYNCEYAEQADPWASPSSLPSLCGELLASQRTALLCTGRELPERQHSEPTSGPHMHAYSQTRICTCACTHTWGAFYISEHRMGSGFLRSLFLAQTALWSALPYPLHAWERWCGHLLPICFEQRHNRSIWRSLLFKRKGENW